MVDNPGVLLDDFAKAGADRCIVHVELGDPRPLFDRLRALGVRRRASSLNPETPVDAVLPYLDEIDLLLVMSVHPGLGGQAFIPEVARQGARRPGGDRRARASPSRSRSTAGINVETAPLAAAAGVDILVAGSADLPRRRSRGRGARDPRAAAGLTAGPMRRCRGARSSRRC